MIPEVAAPPEPQTISFEGLMIKKIPFSFIKEDHATQVRGAVSSARVRDLTALLNETEADLDPIDVFLPMGSGEPSAANPFWLADGYHRVAAYRSAGKAKVPARLHEGGQREAIEFGLRKNGHHGTPMSNKEKRHATELAVLHPEIGQYTDKKIAKMIGVSQTLVNNIRRGVMPAAKPDPEEVAELDTTPSPKKRSGKKESESTAPRSSTVRQRRDTAELNRPTKAATLKRIETELTTSVIDEEDLIELLKSPTGRYVFLPKDGESIMLKVVGTSGREQVNVPVTIREVGYEQITLRYSAGKLQEG